jgi:hypothetical protein
MTETVAAEVEAAIPSTAGKLEASEITEVSKTVVTKDKFVEITMPSTDLYDHTHPGVQLNRHKFEPGKTYLVRADVAAEIQMRLKMFDREQVRLLRPNADRKSLNEVNKGSQWTSRGGSAVPLDGGAADLGTADEKVYTVDF